MNATRPEWMPIIEQCAAQNGVTTGLPSLEADFGRGAWHPVVGGLRRDGTVLYVLYWYTGTKSSKRISHRVGSFDIDANLLHRQRPRHNEKTGALTVGTDEYGRRLVLVDEKRRVVAVAMEQVRGVTVPRPVPVMEPQDAVSIW